MTESIKYQWVETNSPVPAPIRTDDIWFFDSESGWLVNSNGDVRMTIDGGNSWDHRTFHIERGDHGTYLRCMGWGSRDVGWIGALTNGLTGHHSSLLYYTKNGGEDWSVVTNLPTQAPGGICGLYAVSDMVMYGSGPNDPNLPGPAVIKTVDGGVSWELIPMEDHADNLIDIYFKDELTGWVVGGKKDPICPTTKPGFEDYRQYAQLKPVVLKTVDGGLSWENKAEDVAGLICGEWGWKIQFLAGGQIGFVSLEDLSGAALLRSEDGGETWNRVPISDTQGNKLNNNLEGIGFINPEQGWIGGWGDSFQGLQNSYTMDGGESWVEENHIPGNQDSDQRIRINRYRFLGDPPTTGYCSGVKVYKLIIGDDNIEGLAALAEHIDLQDSGFAISTIPTASAKNITINFTISKSARHVYVGIWNHFAVHVRTLLDESDPAGGNRSVIWDGRDDQGNKVSGQFYMCRIFVDGQGDSTLVELQ